MCDAALSYADAGYPVFPLHHLDPEGNCSCGGPERNPNCTPGKHPRTPNGFKDATTDPERIRRWFERWPEANIGIPTGERTGLLVLDEDPRHGGDESLESLTKTHGELPRTKTTKTGGGGRQRFFIYPPESNIRNTTNKPGPGLDIRGEGGYIVAPPSRTTGAYEALDRSPPTTPPEWLLELLREQPGGSGDERATADKPAVSVSVDGEPIPDGTRDDTLTSIAGRLHDGTRTLEQIEADLQAINRARCTPPLPESQVREKARRTLGWEPCSAAPGPDAETLEDLDNLSAAVLDARSWKGKAGKSDRAIYRAYLLLARSFGRRLKHGVKVYGSKRQMAELAGVSSRTLWNGEQRLIGAGLLSRSSEGSGTKAGAMVLLTPSNLHSQVRHSSTGGESPDSVLLVRELLRLRWGKRKLGKSCAELLEHLAFYGSADAGELSEAVNTRRDNVRRTLRRLEARDLVECSSGTWSLPADFLARFDAELEDSGIKRVERLQRERHELQRQAYRAHLEERRRRRSPEPAAEPDKPPEASAEPPQTPEDEARGYSERQFRQLATRARERLPQPEPAPTTPTTKRELVAELCRRLRREDPECFDSLCSDTLRGSLRALGWELSARGWTSAVYSPATLESVLELLEAEPVPVAGAA